MLADGKRSVKPVSGVTAAGQALSNSEPIRSGRPPCTGDIDWCRPSTTPASGWPGRMSVPGRPNGYGGRNCSVRVWDTGRSASSPQRSSHIASVSPLSRQRSGWPPGQASRECSPAAKPLYTAGEPTISFRLHGFHLRSLPPVRWRWNGDASSVARLAQRTNPQEVEPTA